VKRIMIVDRHKGIFAGSWDLGIPSTLLLHSYVLTTGVDGQAVHKTKAAGLEDVQVVVFQPATSPKEQNIPGRENHE
jgi:hypothetical protein